MPLREASHRRESSVSEALAEAVAEERAERRFRGLEGVRLRSMAAASSESVVPIEVAEADVNASIAVIPAPFRRNEPRREAEGVVEPEVEVPLGLMPLG